MAKTNLLNKYNSAIFIVLSLISLLAIYFVPNQATGQVSIACPTDRGSEIISGYGYRSSTSSWHAGVDIGVEYRPIIAAESGEVRTQWYSGYQITKDLFADSGRVYRYAHLSEGGSDGRTSAGNVIGQSGDGGGAVVPHLHWEIRTDGGGFGFDGTINPTSEFNSACHGSAPAPVGSNPGGLTPPSQPTPQPTPQVSVPAPSVGVGCSNGRSVFNVSWSNPGLQGVSSYTVDIDNDNFNGGWWNKDVGTSTSVSGPDGFQFYPPSGSALTLSAGQTYYVRVFYSGPNRHSATATFSANNCTVSQPTPSTPAPVVSSPSTSTSGRIVAAASNRCLDVANFGTGNGSSVQIWDCSGGTNQQWSISSNGEIRIYGNKCLDVANFGTGNGSRVQIWDCSGGSNQKWSRNGGEIRIYGNKCLDVANFGTGNGSNVQIWDCSGGSNQQWRS